MNTPYQNLKKSNLYEYVTRKEGTGGVVEYIGDRHSETKNLPLSSLKTFIEAELFVLQRNDEIPKIKYEISIWGKDSKIIELKLLDVDGSIFSKEYFDSLEKTSLSSQKINPDFIRKNHRDVHSELGFYLHLKLRQIFWRFNYEHIVVQNEKVEEFEKRFTPSITYSQNFVDEKTLFAEDLMLGDVNLTQQAQVAL